jgi:hypothetical protein
MANALGVIEPGRVDVLLLGRSPIIKSEYTSSAGKKCTYTYENQE